MDHFCYLCFVFSVHCSLVVTCWERTDLLALLCVMFSCDLVTFPCGVLGQVWYLIESLPDLCLLPNFNRIHQSITRASSIMKLLDQLIDPTDFTNFISKPLRALIRVVDIRYLYDFSSNIII